MRHSMKKGYLYLATFGLLFLILVSCNNNNDQDFFENAIYDGQLHILAVDYPNNIDTSFQQIIQFSNIRRSGYGILLNINDAYAKLEIDTLKRRLQKLDINSVHSFEIVLQDSVKRNVKVAMAGAKFIWILGQEKLDLQNTYLGLILKSIKNDPNSKQLIVSNKKQYFLLKDFLSDH